MKSFVPEYLKNLRLTPDIANQLRVLGEFKGREALYQRQSPEAMEKLLESAIIQSTQSSNRIEGVIASDKRVSAIVKSHATPRNRSEQEIAGYRDILCLIHQSNQDMPITENVILQFHSMLFRYATIKAGTWKNGDNEIVEIRSDGSRYVRFKPVSAFETSRYMTDLVVAYAELVRTEAYEPLILIPLFVLDFLCVHPFTDGNGRIGRLLTLLLLYKAGYSVGKYISLERIIEDSKEGYYETLRTASEGWHASKHDSITWLSYFYGMLVRAYKEFEANVGIFNGKGSKTEQVVAAINRFVLPFGITEVEKNCPNVSRDMIRKILRDLRSQGIIKAVGRGKAARWQKTGNKEGNLA
ncbi:MAG: cell filamentation protein Fic [Candidatus Raymondbacteria bacterium RifOxyC12_full_50_8]|uniref:Cell filamentation protein Fic n=1 Tax=Candidatus Raymondbacteria bacterium RIFOXYD12_FULL_49_13 TaxID=1817890 RepID=A0A1F7FGN2_UNCRA|nr:MAG: cell filamentation protein Fic [Candidatus Raymondbacteria bacterium RIFOXYA2_FULL_49_16]OGJ94511.1 MAG: cell filamentation protein Fic [Candidatus Raymondbacteria bacterium RifOxyC12_full_50_8]OGJ99277.1 MAG: cell filamentation protein Fic [Candidatus Raymondbacteria bacterium RifOxyB12_full_50_8]OGK05869.1 MAG: cell filamentation protein Fic [Candidatus Raymondbacteria bacterium RIFOXYD12_FULL_49_13]OGP43363.1 MAG: cell filamentation protein Fic [Candidatus Raymondbacteria bacterium R